MPAAATGSGEFQEAHPDAASVGPLTRRLSGPGQFSFMPFSRMRSHTDIDMEHRTRILKIAGAWELPGEGFHANGAPAFKPACRATTKRWGLGRAGAPEDHANCARQYRATADRLDAVAGQYEQRAAANGKRPAVGNAASSTTTRQHALTAQLLRTVAEALRQRASAEERQPVMPGW